ncbi:MAG: class II fructose-bisphosphate aldolase [Clostridiales bacterium]|nr:class II fructose-bisphosphate aldolase [Clostridiales bacterium]
MSLVNAKELLIKAKNKKQAVGAFNFTNFEQLKAIVNACKKENTGCILAVSESAIAFMGIDNIIEIVKNETKNTKVKFALHLDHGKSYEICKKCIDAGFTSVMIDASHFNFEDNIKLTKKVVKYAKKFNVSVEAELGKIEGIEDNTKSLESILTSPTDAVNFIKKTGIDSLAVSIGTSHGAYKFKGESKLQIELLKQINKATNFFPLVLHGASSLNENLILNFEKFGGKINGAKGVDDNSIKQSIKYGICKINVDTDLRIAFTTGIKETLQNESIFNLREYLKNAMKRTEYEVIKKLQLFSLKV